MVLLWTVIALSISLFIGLGSASMEVSGSRANLSPALSRLTRIDDISIPDALRAFKLGMDYYLTEKYAAALDAWPDEQQAAAADIGDYVLFYRAKANLMLDRDKDAVEGFRRLDTKYGGSPLVEDALLGQCQALLKLEDPKSVLSILKDPRIKADSETRYYEARSLDLAGEKDKAIELYLVLYAGYPNSSFAPAAERNLLSLSPGALKGRRNYSFRLLRAESLLKANNIRGARALLLALNRVSAPDPESAQKCSILLADVEYRLGRTTAALSHVRKITAQNPSIHSKAIRLEGACYRRLAKESAFLAQRERALKLYPQSSETEELCYSVATYFDVQYESSKAQQAYKVLFERFPNGRYAERSLWKLALFDYFEKDYSEAAKKFWRYLLAYGAPQPASSAMYWMGRCYEMMGGVTNARYLYGRVGSLANNSYFGQCARRSEASIGRSGASANVEIPGIDFQKVAARCSEIKLKSEPLAEPGDEVVSIIERARRLWAAGLSDLAIFELRWASRRFPAEGKSLFYIISSIRSSNDEHFRAIAGLRDLFPDYASLPSENLPEEVWRILFPTRFLDFISVHAAKAKVDPSLVLALIRQESAFNEKARSPANARGLMQIVPATGLKLARQARIQRYSSNKLFQAETNIILGTKHLAALIQRYGREDLALAAYNAGDSRVDLWLKKFGDLDLPEFVEQIPFSETRGYIRQVLSNKAVYSVLTSSGVPEK